jgi:glycosyltransferase involved in cell wall biosynthesis
MVLCCHQHGRALVLVVAEALACELPVVATDCGGPAEIVGLDEQAGYVVPPKDSTALAVAM